MASVHNSAKKVYEKRPSGSLSTLSQDEDCYLQWALNLLEKAEFLPFRSDKLMHIPVNSMNFDDPFLHGDILC